MFNKMISLIIVLLGSVLYTRSETVLGKETEDFDFDGLPGVSHTFTFELYGGEEQCFYQKIKDKASVFLSYEVTKASEPQVHFTAESPSGNQLLQQMYQQNGHWDYQTTEQGVYTLCFESPEYGYNSMFVNFFLSATPKGAWEKYNLELQKLNIHIDNFTADFEKTESNVQAISWYQTMSEFQFTSDYNHALSSNSYVQNRSIFQCFLILVTATCQILFVRRLFNLAPTTFKQRA